MKQLKRIQDAGWNLIRRGGLLGLLAAGVLTVQVQTAKAQSVDEKLAAMESRIQQLEKELAESKSAWQATGGMVTPVSQTAGGVAAYIRPAVLTTTEPTAAAQDAAPAAAPAGAPPEKTMEEKLKDLDFDALGFFKGTKMSGLLDVYYLYDFNKPASATVPYRNFDFNSKSITLNLAELSLAKAVSKETRVGYTLTLGVGPTADIVNASDPVNPVTGAPVVLNGSRLTGTATVKAPSTTANFLQYYMSGWLPVGKGLTLDFGKFVTPFGAEVIETPSNWNYSRSLLFTLAIPYYHFGVRATQTLSDKASLAFFLVNGWNNVLDNNGGKSYGLSLSLNPNSHFSWVNTYMGGPEQAGNNKNYRNVYDSVLTLNGKKVSFMTNFDYGHDAKASAAGTDAAWYGVALYAKFQMGSKFALIPRWEWFNDRDGLTTGTAQKLKEITLTSEITFTSNLLTRLEYRRDYSDQASFVRGASSPGKSQDTLLGGLILKF